MEEESYLGNTKTFGLPALIREQTRIRITEKTLLTLREVEERLRRREEY